MTVLDLPPELQSKILEYVLTEKMLLVVDEGQSDMIRSSLDILHANKQLRAITLPLFAKMTTFQTRAENLQILNFALKRDLLSSINILDLRISGSARGFDVSMDKIMLEYGGKFAGNRHLTVHLPQLDQYSIEIHLGYPLEGSANRSNDQPTLRGSGTD